MFQSRLTHWSARSGRGKSRIHAARQDRIASDQEQVDPSGDVGDDGNRGWRGNPGPRDRLVGGSRMPSSPYPTSGRAGSRPACGPRWPAGSLVHTMKRRRTGARCSRDARFFRRTVEVDRDSVSPHRWGSVGMRERLRNQPPGGSAPDPAPPTRCRRR